MKVAIVTGASGNLGPIWCETLENNGFGVFKLDLPGYDITKRADVIRAFHQCASLYGIPSVLINNAAIDNPPGSGATFFGNFTKIIDVNLIGAARMCELAIPLMIKNGGGLIINIGSIQGHIGADWRNYDPGFEKPVGYNCSKRALIQLSKSIAVQYGRYKIRSVTLSFAAYDGGKLKPDFLNKYLLNVPLGETVSKKSLQAALQFALDNDQLTGTDILTDGGYTAL